MVVVVVVVVEVVIVVDYAADLGALNIVECQPTLSLSIWTKEWRVVHWKIIMEFGTIFQSGL